MPKIAYIEKNFRPATWGVISQANIIIEEYQGRGFILSLRQLYYQFVARGLIPNTERSYKNLGKIISDGRLAGEIDWNAIEDRGRFVRSNAHWDSPSEIVEACARQFAVDKWDSQPYRVEVWIEKDALVGVIEGVCTRYDVPYLACRGYMSQSEQWTAARRYGAYRRGGQEVVVLHLGDHDPSGLDMTRDNQDRLAVFLAVAEVKRLALNMEQVEEHNPPPNPAKVTDSRFEDYVGEFGEECWELDAMEPEMIADLIETNIKGLIVQDLWDEAVEREREGREKIAEVAAQMEL